MSILGHNQPADLDDFEVFRLWYELGSINKVREVLKSAGIVNPTTGNSWTYPVIIKHAIHWVLENPDEARLYYQKVSAEFAYDDEAWNKYLVSKAQQIYRTSMRRFMSWIDRRGFGTKYQDMYAEQFGLNNE